MLVIPKLLTQLSLQNLVGPVFRELGFEKFNTARNLIFGKLSANFPPDRSSGVLDQLSRSARLSGAEVFKENVD